MGPSPVLKTAGVGAVVVALFLSPVVTSSVITPFAAKTNAQQPSLADAPPGTIFTTLRDRDGGTQRLGLVKRGQSRDRLYNPTATPVELESGDALVARGGTVYSVTRSQTLPGGTGTVGPGTQLFRGERDTRFVGFEGDVLRGTGGGRAAGQSLDINGSVSPRQDLGVYVDTAGNSVTVRTPTVSSLQIRNRNGARVTNESVPRHGFVVVRADVNFLGAESAELRLTRRGSQADLVQGLISRSEAIERFPGHANTIRDLVPEGHADPTARLTQRSLADRALQPAGSLYYIVDLDELGRPGEYQFTVRPEDNAPLGDLSGTGARATASLRVGSAGSSQLVFETNRDVVLQGETSEFSVRGGVASDRHVVSVDATDLRQRPSGRVNITDVSALLRTFENNGLSGVLLDNGEAVLSDGRVFRDGQLLRTDGPRTINGQDIREVFTLVRIQSNGEATLGIDTRQLDDTTVGVSLYAGASSTESAVAEYEQNDATGELRSSTVRVVRSLSRLAITSPRGSYVVGQSVDVRGRAGTADDRVALYVRRGGHWELLPSMRSVPVRSDGTWRARDITLGRENRAFARPGTARLGLITVDDADRDGDGRADETLNRSAFADGRSVQRSLQVWDRSLETGGFRTYDGEVAQDDEVVTVRGNTSGADELALVLVDRRGGVVARSLSVARSGRFSGEMSLSDSSTVLVRGPVEGYILSPGRDGRFGGERRRTVGEFIDRLEELEAGGLTPQQLDELILAATLDDPGSDDRLLKDSFRLASERLDIRRIGPEATGAGGASPVGPGRTVVVAGVTNLRPDGNSVSVEVVRGPEATRLPVRTDRDWGSDGVWRVGLRLPESLATGVYELRAEGGKTATTREFRVVEPRTDPPTPTPTESPSTASPTPSSPTATPPPTATETQPSPTGVTAPPTSRPTTTGAGSPGFGVVTTLVALAVGALLRRRS